MRVIASMYDNLLRFEARRMPRTGVMRALWTPCRWVLAVAAYLGLFIAPLPVMWGLPFGVISVWTGPPSPWWWTLAGLVTVGIVGILVWRLLQVIRLYRDGFVWVEGAVFVLGMCFTTAVAALALPLGMEPFLGS